MGRKRTQSTASGLRLRIDVHPGFRIGPGKITLLEVIRDTGSIAAAGRTLGMSYPRAWGLVEDLNRGCGKPVVVTSPGGKAGGGTRLTPVGEDVVRLYRQIERETTDATAATMQELQRLAGCVALQ